MQGLTGVPKAIQYCLIALALPHTGLLWLLWGKRVTAVIEAYTYISLPMHCVAGTWLHSPAPFRTGRKQFGEERTDGCLRLRDLYKLNHACTLGPRAVK
jgi:hypothetical protein